MFRNTIMAIEAEKEESSFYSFKADAAPRFQRRATPKLEVLLICIDPCLKECIG